MQALKITLIQATLHWEDQKGNLRHFTELVKNLRKGSTDIILLPEMFATGFTMNASKVAEKMDGHSVNWMRKIAAQKNAVVCGSLVIKEKSDYFNRLVWMMPDGTCKTYDKRHLFRMAHEQETYTPGTKRLIVSLKGWRICPLICYDLRFPVWSRNRDEYDLLLYVANWPQKRSYAWKQLLIARAIENQIYLAGLNRIGKDGKDIKYNGGSMVLDPLGKKMSSFSSKETVQTIILEHQMLSYLRNAFPVMLDKDEFKIL